MHPQAPRKQIKDKQKLFKKLFISPTHNQNISPPLLVSPDFINLLLQQSVSEKTSSNYKKQLLNQILNIFIERPINSLLLCKHDEQKNQNQNNKCILDNIVGNVVNVVEGFDQVEVYIEKIRVMLAYYRVRLKNISKVTQMLAKWCFLQKFDSVKFIFIVKLMKLYYSQKLGQSKSPLHYFYIFGTQNQGIQPVQHSISQFTFKHQLTLILTFNSHGPPFTSSNLLHIKTQKKQQLHLSYSSGILKLEAYNNSQFVDSQTLIKQLSQQVWYRMILNLNTTQTQLILNNQSYKYKPMIKRQKERRISACGFGKQFVGMIGGVMMSNKNIGLDKFDMVNYPYGVDSINDLKTLAKNNIQAGVITSCFPFFVFEVRETMHCFDIFKRNHSAISDNIVVVSEPITEPSIDSLGGCQLLLPLFYLARFYDKFRNNILQELLQLLLQILKTYNLQSLQDNFEQSHFLSILGQHLSDIAHFQSIKSINLIFSIYKVLRKQSSKITYFRDVIWQLNIGISTAQYQVDNYNTYEQNREQFLQQLKGKSADLSPTRVYSNKIDQIITQYYKKLLSLYENDPKLAYNSFNMTEIVYWIVQHIESDQNISFSCCLQHSVNQSVLSYEIGVEQFVRLENSHSKMHYLYLEKILTKCLEHQIKNANQSLPQVLKTLLRLFLQKYSSCFYLTILNSIKSQIQSLPPCPSSTPLLPHQKTLIKLLIDPNIQLISFLIFLSQKTINPDIITDILYIALFLQQNLNNETKKQEITKFISNLFKINKTIQIRSQMPKKGLVRKVRKGSFGDLLHGRKYQHEEEEQEEIVQYCGSKVKQKGRRNSVIQKGQQKIKKTYISEHRLSRVISRCPKPEHLSTYQPTYNIILAQLTGNVNQKLATEALIQRFSQHSIQILRQYYVLCHAQQRQSILLYLLSHLQLSPSLKTQNSLTIFLLQSLKQSLYNSPEQTKNLLTIFTCIFSQILSTPSSPSSSTPIIDYYCSIKYLKMSRSAISIILPHILSKVIKLAELSQLFQFAVLGLYEVIELGGDSAQEISYMVIGEIGSVIKKCWSVENEKDKNGYEKASQESFQIYEQLSKIVCVNSEKQASIKIADPFEKQVLQKSFTNQKKQAQMLQTDTFNTKDNFLAPQKQQKIQRKQSSPKSPTQKRPSKILQEKPQPQSNQCYYELSCFQLYIRLFFKLLSHLSVPQPVQQYKRQSIKNMQSNSYLKKTKSNQLNYMYQFKNREILVEEFIETVCFYFWWVAKDINYRNQNYVKFLVSYVLYKAGQIDNLDTNQAQESLDKSKEFNQISICVQSQKKIETEKQALACRLFRSLWATISSLTQKQDPLVSAIQSQRPTNKTTLLQFFTEYPFTLTPSQLQTLPSMSSSALKQIISQSIFGEIPLLQFFNQIQDLHDLQIVTLYQKGMKKYVEDYENIISQYSSEKSLKNIQKLFDTENAAEEKSRVTYYYENECKFRKYQYEWDKLWNYLRIYHQPYGIWMAQKTNPTVFTYPSTKLRNFKFQISQYPTKTGMYPILQSKIIEPWVIIKDNKNKKNKYINSFSQIMKPSHIKLQKNNSQKNVLGDIWKNMWGIQRKHLKNKNKYSEYDVVLICRSVKAFGKLFIQNKEYIIFCYEGARQEDTHLSFQKFFLPYNRETYQKLCIYHIQKIRTHRYLLKYQALQLILIDGRSLIFNFINNDKDIFLKELQRIQRQKIQTYSQKLYKVNKVGFFEQNFLDNKNKNKQKYQTNFDMKITESWMRRQISNLEYLIKINRVASRGIYDLSQYMVVPWVVEFRKEKQPKFRDLTKTMGGLGSEERRKIVSEKYFTKDPFNPYPPFFFGTHYSSPGVVFNILIRLSPFTQYCKHLQGGKFDIPDRLFSSLLSAWRSASQEVSDVRQLIPQMYYLPQLLINIDQNYFGYTQNHELIDHVDIPPWGVSNPYYFVSQLRQLMESDEVSEKINEWIDLIFGYKQKGKQAQQAFNIYYYLTYQDYVDAQQEQDDVYKKSKQAQIVHFGQIPPQLFDRPHPHRPIPQTPTLYHLKFTRTINLMTTLREKPIGIFIQNNELQICKRNQLQTYSTLSEPAVLQKKKKFNFQKSLSQTYYIIKKQRSNIKYFKDKPYFIIWGYFSNQFRIFNRNTGQIEEEDQLESKITTVFVNQDEDIVLVGLTNGLLVVYEIQYGVSEVFVKRVGHECFCAPVVHVSQFDGFFTITFGNYCAIYKIHRSLHYLSTDPKPKPTIKFFRSFSNPLPLKHSFMLGSPLYTIILIDNSTIKSYSINGQLIKVVNCPSNVKHFGSFKDYQLHDVFYLIDEDKAIALSVPDLRNVSILDFKDYQSIIENFVIFRACILEIGFGAV